MTTFKDFPLNSLIQQAIDKLGFTEPTEIQIKAFEHLLTTNKVDFHGQAQTGTGKTLAFGIPLLQAINPKLLATQALIVAPTRELVVQICESLRSVGALMNVSIEAVYGGVSMESQIRALRKGAHIVVGSPGRLNDHLRRRTLNLQNLQTLVLDEADIMLDMGFKEEIDDIIEQTPKDRQIWLFSATVKPGIRDLKQSLMKDPVVVRVAAKNMTVETTKQYYAVVPRKYRVQALCRFIDNATDFYGVVFCQTKLLSNDVAQLLSKRGYAVNALHGDMAQPIRNKIIQGFKDKEFTILVATDVAARGIDIANLNYVVNFSLPEDQEAYVHRIGRTGRAGKEGVAITMLNSSEVRRFQEQAKRFQSNVCLIEVPSSEQIATIRLEKTREKLDTLCVKPVGTSAPAQRLKAMLSEKNSEQLLAGLHNLITETILKGLNEPDEEINFQSLPSSGGEGRSDSYRSGGDRRDGRRSSSGFSARRGTRYDDSNNSSGNDRFKRTDDDGGGQEIMLNIGSDDGVTSKDIMNCINSAKSMAGSTVNRIHIIKRRTFITVAPAQAHGLFRELNGKTVCGKQVRISWA